MLADGELLLAPLGVVFHQIGRGGIHHRVVLPMGHKHTAVRLVVAISLVAYIATEDGHILLVAPRLGIVDEQEMAHFIELENDIVLIIVAQRTALDDSGQRQQGGDVAMTQHPLEMAAEIARYLHRIVVVGRLVGHGLLAHLYSPLVPQSGIDGRGGRELVVIVHALQDIRLVSTVVELSQLRLELYLRAPAGHRLANITPEVVQELAVLAAMEQIVYFAVHCYLMNVLLSEYSL